MKSVLVWDLPVRLFHILLAAGFIAAAILSVVIGEDGPLFPYHGIIGLTLGPMVVLRLVWGVVGTRYARFGSFVFPPGEVVAYMKGTLDGTGKRHIGHNPGSSVAIFALLGLVLALGVTGFMLGRGNESVKDAHELIAWVAVGVASIHVLGVAFHMLRHRENIVASMVHGKKVAEPSEAIGSARPFVAVVLLLVAGSWALGLVRNYRPATQTTTLPVLGTSMQLGEFESGGEAGAGERAEYAEEGGED